jgi:DNA (cytosine-5)-methyltransferase 1
MKPGTVPGMETAMKLIASILKTLGMNGGKPRLWLQGRMPERAGFVPGVSYSIERREDRTAVVLRLADDGKYVVSKKKGKSGDDALIDLNSQRILGMFEGARSVRVLIGRDEIWILPDAFDVKRKERIERFQRELDAGQVMAGALAHGIGVMTNALHEGMKAAGLKTKLRFAVEIEEDSLDVASENNPSWDADTIAVAMPIQQLAFGDQYTLSRLPKVSLLDFGLPCTAASVAGRAKKHLVKPEDDEKAGHLVAAAVALVAHFNPFTFTCENVSPWFNTASAALFRTQMKEFGYEIHEHVVHGEDYALEARERTVWIGMTVGAQLDLSAMVPPPRLVATLGDVMEDVPEDSPLWRTMDYLKEKEIRDAADGKGFRMSLGDASTSRVGVLGRGYGKCRGTELKVIHPRDPELLRQLTPKEHAAVKGIPTVLFAGQTSVTRIHEWLGQSVIWPAFRHLGEVVGRALATGVVRPVAVQLQSDQVDVPNDLFEAIA